MSAAATTVPLPRAIGATRLAFGLAGALIAGWAPLVPYARARLEVGEGALGSLLLCVGLGALLTMPWAGALGRRLGVRGAIGGACAAALALLPVLATASSVAGMALALTLFGAALGLVDLAANLQAAEIERRSGQPLMSGFHGAWSIGTIVGGGLVSALLASAGLSPLGATLALAALAAATTAAMLGGLAPRARTAPGAPTSAREPSRWAWPQGTVWGLALMCMVIYLVEHSVLDWSAVYMSTARGADAAASGWAYTGFATAMTAGRLGGDRLRAACGDVRLVGAGSAMGAAGLGLVVGIDAPAAALAGYALLGLSVSNIVPVLFSLAGRDTVLPPGQALTAVATVAFFGALGGPALIGWLAHASSLTAAFLVLAGALLAVAAGSRSLRAAPSSLPSSLPSAERPSATVQETAT